VGFEFHPHAVAWTREKGHRLIDRLSPECGPEGGFDVVCLFQVLEHLADPFGMLETLRGLLSRQGTLIVTVPDAGGPVRYFSDALTDQPPHHVTRWHGESMSACARRRGLQLKDLAWEPLPRYVWRYYLPVMLERDLLPRRLGRLLNESGATGRFLGLLERLGVGSLRPLRGHTLYAAFGL
jgi:hypothetical protein